MLSTGMKVTLRRLAFCSVRKRPTKTLLVSLCSLIELPAVDRALEAAARCRNSRRRAVLVVAVFAVDPPQQMRRAVGPGGDLSRNFGS
jgi:hypothetical protein